MLHAPYPQVRVGVFELAGWFGVAGPQSSGGKAGQGLREGLRSRHGLGCGFVWSIVWPGKSLSNNVLIWEEWQHAHPCCCCWNGSWVRCCSQP